VDAVICDKCGKVMTNVPYIEVKAYRAFVSGVRTIETRTQFCIKCAKEMGLIERSDD